MKMRNTTLNKRKILCTFLIALLLTSLIIPEISARPKKRRGRKKGRKRKNTDPTINYIRAKGPTGRLDPAGTIGTGNRVRMYTRVSDAETASASLTVNISYRPQGGNWTTRAATYDAPNNYWYVSWTIPEGADPGLYDVKVDVSDGKGGSATATELGEYNVI